MWIAKLVIKHSCFIGNKCEKYSVSTISVPFNIYIEKDVTYSPEFHTLWGDEKNIKKFISALKKDKNLKNIEVDGNKVFLIEVTKKKLPVTIRAKLQQKIIWVKPIYINVKGEEHWEIASWDKRHILNFIAETKKVSKYVILESVKETKLKDIYYTRLLPQLSPKQKEAMTLAFEEGYYNWPKKTDFQKLSQRMKLSVSTFREHLKKAEKKILPDLIKQL
jgi:predicted DNA binding protein